MCIQKLVVHAPPPPTPQEHGKMLPAESFGKLRNYFCGNVPQTSNADDLTIKV